MGKLDFICTAGWGWEFSGPEREKGRPERGCWRGGCAAGPGPPALPSVRPGVWRQPGLQDGTGEQGSGS